MRPVRAVTEAVVLWPTVTSALLVMTGCTGVLAEALMVTLLLAGAPWVLAVLNSRQVMLATPAAPAVQVMLLMPAAVTPAVPPVLVMVPPLSVQRYFMPVRAGTWALSAVAPATTGLAAVMTGVTGAATTVRLFEPAVLARLAALRSTQVSFKVPTTPAVKVSWLTAPVVTPVAPPALVMVPPVMVQV